MKYKIRFKLYKTVKLKSYTYLNKLRLYIKSYHINL